MSVFLVASLYLLVSGSRPYGVEGSGEYCHGWADAYNIWHKGFQCPERYDGPEARYCCGTCALRYCCNAAEARLDQSTCDNDNFFEFENDGNSSKRTLPVATYFPFLIVVGAFVSFVAVGAVVAACCCRCLKPKPAHRPGCSAQIQNRLLESAAPSSDAMTPSRHSSASSSSVGRSSAAAGRPQNVSAGPEVAVSVFGSSGNGYHPVMGPQTQQYMPATQPAGPFFQPYLSYGVPPEHTVLMTQAYLDSRAAYGQSQGHPFPQAPMHTEPLYPGVSV